MGPTKPYSNYYGPYSMYLRQVVAENCLVPKASDNLQVLRQLVNDMHSHGIFTIVDFHQAENVDVSGFWTFTLNSQTLDPALQP